MNPKRSAVDWVFELLAVAAVLSMAAMLALHWNELPTRVPRHFGISGKPDGWGAKTGLLVLPLTGLGIWSLLTAASKYQSLINLPIVVDRQRLEVKALLLSLSIALKTSVALMFACITWASVNTALNRTAGLGRLFLPIVLCSVGAPLLFYVSKLRAYRTTEKPG